MNLIPPFMLFIRSLFQFNSVQSLSHVWLFVTPGTAAHQVSLSITNSRSLLKLMSIESVMPSNHLTILCCPLFLLPSPASGSFQISQLFASGGLSIGVSASPLFQARLYWSPCCSRGEQWQTSGPLACLLPKEGLSCSLYDVGPGIGLEG